MEEKRICINCGKYIGAREVCPYCGEEQPKPIGIEFLKWTSIIIATGGLIFLFISARVSEAPLIKIKDLKPTMNFAKISMKGIVESSPYYNEERGGYFSFWLNDGTGSIKVRAFKNVARELIEKETYPCLGDSVYVTGILYTRENFLLTINDINDIKVKIPQAKKLLIKDITDTLEGQRIETEGTVFYIREYRNKSIGMRIGDKGSFITVYIPFYYKNKEKVLALEKRTVIKVKGVVPIYKEKPEIIPHYVSDIKIIGRKEIKVEGKILKGEVKTGYAFKKGIKIKIETEEGEKEVLLWKKTFKRYKRNVQNLLTGAVVEFEIYEKEYKGKEEYVVRKFNILSYPEKILKIKELLERNYGEFLKTKGKIVDLREFKPGAKITIEDNTGKLTVWIWRDIWEEVKDFLKFGKTLIIAGEFKEFRGKPELVPRVSEDIIISE